jgi:hypothetical protein
VRAALAASEYRTDVENTAPVSARAIEAARLALERTIGTTDPHAALARIRALRLRENAFIQIDPPPPLGARMTPQEFTARLAARVKDVAQPDARDTVRDTLRDSA